MALPFGEFYTDVTATMPDGETRELGGGPWSTRQDALASVSEWKRKLKSEGALKVSGRVYKEKNR